MQYLLNLATWLGLGMIATSPVLITATVYDIRDRRRHRAAMARWRAGE